MEHELTDWRGTPIRPGATIVYPARQGSSLWLTEAEVVEIVHREDTETPGLRVRRLHVGGWRGQYGDQRSTAVVYKLDNVTVVSARP
jgi:hypothetical protein